MDWLPDHYLGLNSHLNIVVMKVQWPLSALLVTFFVVGGLLGLCCGFMTGRWRRGKKGAD